MFETWIRNFLEEYGIGRTTMNFITTPMVGPVSFPAFLYLLVFIISVGIIVLRKKITKAEIIRAVIISFIAAGFLFVFRMDYNWLRIFKNDSVSLSGKSVEEKIKLLEGKEFYDFIQFVKNSVPKGGKVRFFPDLVRMCPDGYYQLKGRYLMLPVKSSTSGEFIWVFDSNNAYFVPVRAVLKIGEYVISPVRPVASYGGGYLFQVIKG